MGAEHLPPILVFNIIFIITIYIYKTISPTLVSFLLMRQDTGGGKRPSRSHSHSPFIPSGMHSIILISFTADWWRVNPPLNENRRVRESTIESQSVECGVWSIAGTLILHLVVSRTGGIEPEYSSRLVRHSIRDRPKTVEGIEGDCCFTNIAHVCWLVGCGPTTSPGSLFNGVQESQLMSSIV